MAQESPEVKPYLIDSNRIAPETDIVTGIFVRAKNGEKWESIDFWYLDKDSMIRFIRSRGEVHGFAVNIILQLMGHGQMENDILTEEN